uniref:Zf-RVT domain-containing protein n=1 Tax=Syphacia muris TaxID=451379 RepID=A0A0N5ANG8_9BILA
MPRSVDHLERTLLLKIALSTYPDSDIFEAQLQYLPARLEKLIRRLRAELLFFMNYTAPLPFKPEWFIVNDNYRLQWMNTALLCLSSVRIKGQWSYELDRDFSHGKRIFWTLRIVEGAKKSSRPIISGKEAFRFAACTVSKETKAIVWLLLTEDTQHELLHDCRPLVRCAAQQFVWCALPSVRRRWEQQCSNGICSFEKSISACCARKSSDF